MTGQSTGTAPARRKQYPAPRHQSISPFPRPEAPLTRLSPPPPPPLPRRSIPPSIRCSCGQFATSRRDSEHWEDRSGRARLGGCGHVVHSDLRENRRLGRTVGRGGLLLDSVILC